MLLHSIIAAADKWGAASLMGLMAVCTRVVGMAVMAGTVAAPGTDIEVELGLVPLWDSASVRWR
jgi:hypothetical protein